MIVTVLLTSTLLLGGCNRDSDESIPELSALSVDGASKEMYPQFDGKIRHYAIECRPSDILTIRATTEGSRSKISVDDNPATQRNAEVELVNPSSDQDIVIDVDRGALTGRYTLHCLAEDFPEIEILRAEAETTQHLMLVSPRFRQNGEQISHLIILDNHGVPRFRRKIDGVASDFKRHANGLYSHTLGQGRNEFGNADSVIVILDENLNEIDRLATVGLTQTDGHDFLFTDEGNGIFISYDSTTRDMSAFGLSTQEIVGDSVIQEVSADGEVIFQWNSWDHIDIADCQATGYPRFASDYGHLNSLDLTDDGDLIASFRGCGQILKIDRPSGDVIWYLGGSRSDFAIVGDPFNEFCGQHTAMELAGDRVLMFDNGGFCLGDREAVFGQFSRVVEYRLDIATGQANFVRDHSLNGSFQEFTRSQGSVQPLLSGNWLIGWGNGPDMSVTEVTESGQEVFAMKITSGESIAVSYRAFREDSLPIN